MNQVYLASLETEVLLVHLVMGLQDHKETKVSRVCLEDRDLLEIQVKRYM